jgi:hypothetical protein
LSLYRGSPVPVTDTDGAPAAQWAAWPRRCHPQARASVRNLVFWLHGVDQRHHLWDERPGQRWYGLLDIIGDISHQRRAPKQLLLVTLGGLQSSISAARSVLNGRGSPDPVGCVDPVEPGERPGRGGSPAGSHGIESSPPLTRRPGMPARPARPSGMATRAILPSNLSPGW